MENTCRSWNFQGPRELVLGTSMEVNLELCASWDIDNFYFSKISQQKHFLVLFKVDRPFRAVGN